jgi:hypothetical protein
MAEGLSDKKGEGKAPHPLLRVHLRTKPEFIFESSQLDLPHSRPALDPLEFMESKKIKQVKTIIKREWNGTGPAEEGEGKEMTRKAG